MANPSYQQIVSDAFNHLGFSPRGDQALYVEVMLRAVTNKEHPIDTIVLSGSTGCGKSILGLAFAESYGRWCLMTGEKSALVNSVVLTATNALSEQYQQSFSDHPDIMCVKGQNNYECDLIPGATASSCVLKTLDKMNKDEIPSEFQHYESTCNYCSYQQMVRNRSETSHVITNYSLFFINQLLAHQRIFNYRNVYVFDETHLLNDLFTEHCGIFIDDTFLSKMVEELTPMGLIDVNESFTLGKWNRLLRTDVEIDQSEMLFDLGNLYNNVCKRIEIDQKLNKTNLKKTIALNTLFNKYQDRFCKINDFVKYNWESVAEHKVAEKSYSIKPVFIKNMYKTLTKGSSIRLHMSATITENDVINTMDVDPAKLLFLKIPSTFPPETKELIFYKPIKLNYNSLKEKSVTDQLITNVNKILSKNNKVHGLIITPSFKMTSMIAEGLEKTHKVFEHTSGMNLQELVQRFKNSKKPSVLISPSIHEGISFDNDFSRFQIIVKASYPSLGDKRMKYICDNYPNIYQGITIAKMVQGAGRGTRHENDWSKTYILDSNAESLWKSHLNIWRDEFLEKKE